MYAQILNRIQLHINFIFVLFLICTVPVAVPVQMDPPRPRPRQRLNPRAWFPKRRRPTVRVPIARQVQADPGKHGFSHS